MKIIKQIKSELQKESLNLHDAPIVESISQLVLNELGKYGDNNGSVLLQVIQNLQDIYDDSY